MDERPPPPPISAPRFSKPSAEAVKALEFPKGLRYAVVCYDTGTGRIVQHLAWAKTPSKAFERFVPWNAAPRLPNHAVAVVDKLIP